MSAPQATLIPGTLNDGDPTHITYHNGIASVLTWLAGGRHYPTAVQTTSYSPAPGDLALFDATAANLTAALPIAPADATSLSVKMQTTASSHTVTVQAGGADTFDDGTTSKVLTTAGSVITCLYLASLAKWYITGNLSGSSGTLDSTAADFLGPGDQSAGVSSLAARADHQHPADDWIPADNGLLIVNYDPMLSSAGGVSSPVTAGTVYLLKVTCHRAMTVSTLRWAIGVAGAGASSGSFIGIYNSAGTRLQTSADIAAGLTSIGPQSASITSQALAAGSFYWIGIVVNLATTQPTFRSANTANSHINTPMTAANLRVCINGTGQTALPASITPSSNSGTNAVSIWVGAT
jgi:hypothetical protein